jgi:hypothetical protein
MGCCVSLSVNCVGLRCWSSTRLATCRSPQGGGNLFFQLVNRLRKRHHLQPWLCRAGRNLRRSRRRRCVARSPAAPRRSKEQAIGCVSTPISCPSTFAPKTSLLRRRRYPAAARQERSPKIAKTAHHRQTQTRPVPPSCVRAISRAGVCRNFAALGACNSL